MKIWYKHSTPVENMLINKTKMDLKTFINIVKKHEAVWNRSSDLYKDIQLREKAWIEICREAKCGDPRKAKEQWKRLRDCHRDAVKRRMRCKNEGKKEYSWKYQDLMKFLLPHMVFDKNNYTNENETNIIQHDSDSSDSEKLVNISSKIKDEESNFLHADVGSGIEFLNDDEGPNKFDGSKDSDLDLDPLDHFFASVCQSTKRLPVMSQLKIKRKIMNLIIEEEENYFTSKNS